MSHTQKATGRRDTTAGEQLITAEDADKLIHMRIAEYHKAHVYDIRVWAQWRSLPFYKRWWHRAKLELQAEWERAKIAWNWFFGRKKDD